MRMKHIYSAGLAVLAASTIAFGGAERRQHQRKSDLRRDSSETEAD